MISARIAQETKKADKDEPKPIKKFSDFNFTPINARVAEVLAIRGDPEFRWPSKITRNPYPRKKDKTSTVSSMRQQATLPRGA